MSNVNANSVGLEFSTAPTHNHGVGITAVKVKNNIVEKTFGFRISKLWNSLPANLKPTVSLEISKKWYS